jgi:hypothetical protein
LEQKYKEAKKVAKREDNLIIECAKCKVGMSKKNLYRCGRCHSVFYCSKDCQVDHWKQNGGHKQECKKLQAEWVRASQPKTQQVWNIPRIALAIPPSFTGYEKDVRVFLPMWDLQDKELCEDIKTNWIPHQPVIVRSLKTFFKLEHTGGKTDVEMVGDMCIDAFALYLLGFKDINGASIQLVSSPGASEDKLFSMTYRHYTKVPKGWQIPASTDLIFPTIS